MPLVPSCIRGLYRRPVAGPILGGQCLGTKYWLVDYFDSLQDLSAYLCGLLRYRSGTT